MCLSCVHLFYNTFHWFIAAAPTAQLSDAAVAAIASTISIISFLIILILATIAIFSIVKYKQNRRRKAQFEFQRSVSLSEVQSTGEEYFTEIEDEKKDLASTWKEHFVLHLKHFVASSWFWILSPSCTP